MKNVKKVLSVLLAALMLYAIGMPFAAADDVNEDDYEWIEVKWTIEEVTSADDWYFDWDEFCLWCQENEEDCAGLTVEEIRSWSYPQFTQRKYWISHWVDESSFDQYGPYFKELDIATGETTISDLYSYTIVVDPDLGPVRVKVEDPYIDEFVHCIKKYNVGNDWVRVKFTDEELAELNEGDWYVDKAAWAEWLIASGECDDMADAISWMGHEIGYDKLDGEGGTIRVTRAAVYYGKQSKAVREVYDDQTSKLIPIYYEGYTIYGFTFIKQYHASEQPDTPAQPDQPAAEICHWCGQPHGDGFFQKIIAFFHRIFASIFGNKY